MANFDWFVLVVMALSAVLGLWRGMVSEVLSLAAWVVAFILANHFSDDVAPLLYGLVGEGVLAHVGAFVLVYVVTMVLFALLRSLATELLRAVGLGGLDRVLGAVFGLLRGLVILVVLVMLAGMTDFPQKAWWQDARFSRPLETVVILVSPYLPDALVNRIRFR